jgi:demethylmenaquinone methyltransferase/2-methoxy-6-polyprenyl-1,4-benzoquinol methylase
MHDYQKNRPETIQDMFNSISIRYDLANSILSFRMHKLWNKRLIKKVTQRNRSLVHVDLCSGTGEIAFSLLRKAKEKQTVYLVDFSEGMLGCAKEKLKRLGLSRHTVHFRRADVQNLPIEDSTADSATLAYGVRNVKDPRLCIKEAYRILKPGGKFGILELTEPSNPLIRVGHQFYLKMIIPSIGKLLTSNQDAYEYLSHSIKDFIRPEEIEKILQEAGFVHTSIERLSGGIATLLYAEKPS